MLFILMWEDGRVTMVYRDPLAHADTYRSGKLEPLQAGQKCIFVLLVAGQSCIIELACEHVDALHASDSARLLPHCLNACWIFQLPSGCHINRV